MAYDGFISYSHAADGRFAPALQRGLQRLAKPWNARRALRIFRDETGLSTSPHLWSAIETALDDSEWFVLLASEEAAQSEWVNKEISHWRATKSVDRILPVVTDGSWGWDATTRDFTPDSTAVPDALRGALVAEPRHLDLRWARDETDLDLRNSRFRSAVADLAAPMHGVAKDELEGEDVRQHRRARRLARGGVSALVVLVVVAAMFGLFAVGQRDRANGQSHLAIQHARLADARRLATTAVSGARDNLSRSALLAIEANRLVNNAETRGALLSLAEDAAPVRELIHGSWDAAAVAPDGRTVAMIGAEGVALVDLETRKTRSISRVDFHDVVSAAFSPNGRLLALGGDDVKILSARTGVPARSPLRFPIRLGAERTLVTTVRFSPDGSDIVAVTAVGQGLEWSVANGAELGRFQTGPVPGTFTDVAFSPDGRWLAATSSGGVLLDAHSLQPRYPRPPPLDLVEYDIVFSPDGRRFAAATSDFGQANASRIVIRDSATGAVVGPSISERSAFIARLAYSPDGRIIAGVLGDGTVTEWDADSGAVRRDTLPGATRVPVSMTFTHDGRLVVVTTAEIVVLDLEARLAREIAAPNPTSSIDSLALSPDGRSVAAGDVLGRIRVWDLVSGELQRTIQAATPLGGGAWAITYQPGTGAVVVGAGDGTLSAWDPRTGRRIHAPIRLTQPNFAPNIIFPGLGVFGVTFDARGSTLVALTGDGHIVVIDPRSWTVRRTFRLVDDAPGPQTLALSPDGQTVALAAPRVVVTSNIRGTHRRRLEVGPTIATSIALQQKRRMLAVGLFDGRILLADTATTHLEHTLVSNHGGVPSIAFNSTGSTLAIGGYDGTVTLWSVADRQPIGPPLTSSQAGTSIQALMISPHNDSLFAASSDGSVVRYQLQSTHWIDQLCAVIGRNLNPAERHAYLTDPTAGRQTCANWPVEP